MIYKWSSNFRPHNINNFSFYYRCGHNVGINKHTFHVASQIINELMCHENGKYSLKYVK